MSLIKTNNSHVPSLYTDLLNIDRFFEQPLLRGDWPAAKIPAANVSEHEKEFLIELAVPGMNRENMKIDVENRVLTVSGHKEVKEEKKGKNGHYMRREYSYDSFSRSFELPDTVQDDGIKATYQNGVLELHLPKKSEHIAEAQRREVSIS